MTCGLRAATASASAPNALLRPASQEIPSAAARAAAASRVVRLETFLRSRMIHCDSFCEPPFE